MKRGHLFGCLTGLLCWVGMLTMNVFADEAVQTDETEFVPAAIWTDADHVPGNDFEIGRAIDGKRETHAALLDTTRHGGLKTTLPPNGDFPITATVVLDLGSERSVCGVRFFTPRSWKALGVRELAVFTCGDPQGKTNVRTILERDELLPMNYGLSVVSTWKPVTTRYLGLAVKNAYQIRDQRQGLSATNVYNVCFSEIRCLTRPPEDPVRANPPEQAFPEDRLFRDWCCQDHGLNVDDCFTSAAGSEIEVKMIEKVLSELEESTKDDSLRGELETLVAANAPGGDQRWKNLYLKACRQRRLARMRDLFDEEIQIVYVKHHVFGGTEGLNNNAAITDRQYRGSTPESKAGSALCLLSFQKDGAVKHEILVDNPDGIIRDPDVSYDANTVVFSMRDSYQDDYHLYRMDLKSRKITQITFTPENDGRKYPCCEIEPCFTPDGGLLFISSRNMQIDDCWPEQNGMIYSCDFNGNNLRRLTYDELDVNYPQMMNDGRVLFTRWEYSDRNAYFLHPLFTMNIDGTMQTEYCGNNSMFPSSYLQSRAIPDSDKVVSIISGHHVPNKGKLALIDRSLGTQDGKCIEFVAGSSPDGTPGRKRSWIEVDNLRNQPTVDRFGQTGPQYQNPFALDEEHYLVGFCPEGWASQSGPYNPPFGVYWMTADGERELLAFDWKVSSTQPVALLEREKPVVKPSQVRLDEKYGTYIVQDIYYGPGLEGIPRGTVKKIRVIALEYRAAWIGTGANAGEIDAGYVQTPISLNNGSWDVKHVLGEVDVKPDGSAAFHVPARTPVYFQLIDKDGYCVQTMRSWSTLQPGEVFACLGCHEDKLNAGETLQSTMTAEALREPTKLPRPFAGKTHRYIEKLETAEALDSLEIYAGLSVPAVSVEPDEPVAGFSYRQEIQPIWDKHCVSCHSGKSGADAEPSPSPTLTAEPVKLDISDPKVLKPWYYERVKREYYEGIVTPLCVDWKRAFTRSYVELTNYGFLEGSRWIQWLEVRSRPQMLPPYHTGSCKSPLMNYLQPSHYNVQVSEDEKRTVACWIDLLIPFCGSYPEANTWSGAEREIYRYYLEKRRFYAEQEFDWVRKEKRAAAENEAK